MVPSPTDPTSGGAGDVPKLTIGQRLLTSLPQLRPERPTRPSRPGSDQSADTDPGADPTDNDAEESAGDESSAPQSVGSRLKDSLLKPPPARQPAARVSPYADSTSAELIVSIKRIDDRERRFAFVAAPIGAILGLVLMFQFLHNNPVYEAHHVLNKKHVADSLIVTYGMVPVVFGIVVGVAAYLRRRSFTVFSLILLGYPFLALSGNPITILPFWGLAGWLFFRSFKMQRELTARGENPRVRTRTAPGARSTRSGSSKAGTAKPKPKPSLAEARAQAVRAKAERRAGRGRPAPAGPPPNKRYTPPKPPRPKIPKE